ncbi:hypothetical protein CRG98_032540, partial [Punica granatum]
MTRVLVPRGSSSASSSNPSRSSSLSGNSSVGRTEQQSVATPQVASAVKEEENQEDVHDQVLVGEDFSGSAENKNLKGDDHLLEGMSSDLNESVSNEIVDGEFTAGDETTNADEFLNGFGELKVLGRGENEGTSSSHTQNLGGNLHPPPPPVPPPKPLSTNSNLRRSPLGSPNSARVASARRAVAWPVVSTRTSPTASRPSSPRSHGESEGYNSADEQSPGFISYDDLERERQFEIDIRRAKGLEVKKMLEDGNCLFRAVADQVYGDSELYDDVRQMCIDYMERNRDHFSQFITEGFVSYCKRKRRDK